MFSKKCSLLISTLLLSTLAFSAQATTGEPSLKSILKTEYDGSWTKISFNELASESWNVAGTTLTFSLIAEYADNAGKNSFSIKDGDDAVRIFSGKATPASPDVSYVLTDSLSSLIFKTGSTQINQFRIYENPLGQYAFAFEDTIKHSDKDYNDMVVTMHVTPATAVPEPESLAMMMAGLGLMGWMRRRQQ